MVIDTTDNANAPTGINTQAGGYDLDGNGIAFDNFYGTLEDSIAFDHAIIDGCHTQPIGTMLHINGRDLNIVNSTLSGLRPEDGPVSLGSDGIGGTARFSNITIEDAHGEIIIRNAIVDGLQVSGNVTVVLQAGQLNDFTITPDSNVILRTEGGTLNRVHFDGANFDERSSFANAVIRGSEILNCNFDHVDFSRADISEVHIGGGNISGNFNGAMLRNMSIAADIRRMEVSESTTFHNVQVFDPTLQQYRRVDNIDQFNAIKRSYDVAELARGAGLNTALQPTTPEPATAPSMDTYELRATPAAAVLNPAPTMTGDATQPGQSVSGGLARTDENIAETIARLGGALTQNFGQNAVTPTSTDLTQLNRQTLDTQDAQVSYERAVAIGEAISGQGHFRA